MLDAADAILHCTPDSGVGVRMRRDEGAAHVLHHLDNGANLGGAKLHALQLVGGTRNTARGADLDVVGSLPHELSSSKCHTRNTIGKSRHVRIGRAA